LFAIPTDVMELTNPSLSWQRGDPSHQAAGLPCPLPTTEKTPRRDSIDASNSSIPSLHATADSGQRTADSGQPSLDPDPKPRRPLATQGPEVGGGVEPHHGICCRPVRANGSSGWKPLCGLCGITRPRGGGAVVQVRPLPSGLRNGGVCGHDLGVRGPRGGGDGFGG